MKKIRTVLHEDALGALVGESLELEGEETDADAILAWMKERAQDEPRTLDDMLTGVKEYVDHWLTAEGWPPSDTFIAYDPASPKETWRAIPPEQDWTEGEARGLSEFCIKKAAEPMSCAWHMAQIAFSLRCLRDAKGASRELALFRHGLKIGTYMKAVEMRRHHLRKAETGKKQLRSSKMGNEIKSAGSFAALHGAAAQAKADQIARARPDLSWTAIRKTLAREFGVSTETIKNSVRNPKKAG